MRSLHRLAAAALLLAATLPAQAKTMVFCSEADPESLNPQVTTTVTGMNATEPMFEGLVKLDGHGGIVPGLAESWTIAADGTEYTFHLRRGVAFHANAHFTPSRPLTADDVVFSIERQWREDNPFHHPADQSFSYFQDMEMAGLIKAVDRVDDLTVRFRLTRPEAPFLADLAMPFAKVLSAEYAAAMLKAGTPELLDQEPVGTGPFAFESYRKEVTLRFRGFPGYWNGRPPIDTLVFSITPNASVRLTKLKAGECQIMSFPTPMDADRIQADPQLRLLRQEGLNIGYLSLNSSRPPFDDVRVRRAVNMAIDKQTLVRAIYGRGGSPAKDPLPPSLWSYNDDIQDYGYDPAAAQKLMEEAGLSAGVEVALWYMPVTRPYNPDSRRMAEMVSDDLARIGIRARLVTASWPDYRAHMLKGDADMGFYGWTSDNGDPDNFLGILLGCHDGLPYALNIAKWCDADYDALISRAKLTADRAERERLYRAAQVIVHRAAPWVPIAHGVVLSAARRTVRGFELDPFGRYLFDKMDLGPAN